MSWSNKYLNIPYKAGTTDCWGLVCNVYKNELNIILNNYSVTDDNLNDKLDSISEVYKNELTNWQKIDNNKCKPFDVLMFNLAGRPLHCGIVINERYMLHSENAKIGSCIEDYTLQRWQSRLIGVYRYNDKLIFKA